MKNKSSERMLGRSMQGSFLRCAWMLTVFISFFPIPQNLSAQAQAPQSLPKADDDHLSPKEQAEMDEIAASIRRHLAEAPEPTIVPAPPELFGAKSIEFSKAHLDQIRNRIAKWAQDALHDRGEHEKAVLHMYQTGKLQEIEAFAANHLGSILELRELLSYYAIQNNDMNNALRYYSYIDVSSDNSAFSDLTELLIVLFGENHQSLSDALVRSKTKMDNGFLDDPSYRLNLVYYALAYIAPAEVVSIYKSLLDADLSATNRWSSIQFDRLDSPLSDIIHYSQVHNSAEDLEAIGKGLAEYNPQRRQHDEFDKDRVKMLSLKAYDAAFQVAKAANKQDQAKRICIQVPEAARTDKEREFLVSVGYVSPTSPSADLQRLDLYGIDFIDAVPESNKPGMYGEVPLKLYLEQEYVESGSMKLYYVSRDEIHVDQDYYVWDVPTLADYFETYRRWCLASASANLQPGIEKEIGDLEYAKSHNKNHYVVSFVTPDKLRVCGGDLWAREKVEAVANAFKKLPDLKKRVLLDVQRATDRAKAQEAEREELARKYQQKQDEEKRAQELLK